MSQKKLAIFITRLICGGAQKVVIDLLSCLNRARYDITLIVGKTLDSEPNLLDKIPNDVRIIRLDHVVREISPLKDIYAFLTLLRFFKREKFDILHLHTSKAGVLGSIAGHIAGIKKIIYTPHGHIFHKKANIPGLSEISPLKRELLYYLRKYAYKCCTQLVALSEKDKEEQVILKLAPPEKFNVIMNGINIEHFSDCDEKLKQDTVEKLGLQNFIVIGSIGRLSEEKGHDILLKTFALISKKIPSLRLLIIGSGDFSCELQKLSVQLDIDKKVIFIKHVDDVNPFLHIMDIFVLPSRYESQGIAAMEAMCAKIPVVASNVGGIPGIIENNINGLLADPENPDSFADAILKLINDKEMKRKIVEKAFERAVIEFTTQRMLTEYEKIFEEESQ